MLRKVIPYNSKLKKFAKKLRSNMTLAEVILWKELKGKKMCGFDFDRQRPIGEYIVDFFCKDLMLAIEVDGCTHDLKEKEDKLRQENLEKMGVRFLRFWDAEVKHDKQSVLDRIRGWIDVDGEPTPACGHPSKEGISQTVGGHEVAEGKEPTPACGHPSKEGISRVACGHPSKEGISRTACGHKAISGKPTSSIVKTVVSVALVLALSGCADKSAVLQADGYMVGAHYYSWYPTNWGRGCLRRILEPKQYPMLGFYDSQDSKVVEQHIAWCSQYGVDFLTLDWWPGRSGQSEYIKEVFLQADNIKDIKFCIFYETWSLSFNPDIGSTAFDDKVTDTFIEDMTSLEDDFFDHPSYLRVGGRPVVVLYLSRTMAGDFKNALKRLRREMAKRGHDIFLIGDEVFWNVSPVVKKGEVPHPLVSEPQVGRIRCFDAITSYNMYENELKDQAGYGAESSFVSDVSSKYDEYLEATRGDVYFVPGIMPGYNDRAGRLLSDHYVIPRRWSKDDGEGSFFEKSIDNLALKYADSRLNMFMITSWNEWNEDTGIEPLKLAEPTTLDRGTGGTNYTGGYKYGGYGMKYLEILRDRVTAVYGRVLDEDGKPVAGVDVVVRQGDVIVKGLSDSRGYYRISRLKLKPGDCEVCVGGQEAWKVDLESDSSVELEDSEVEN